MRTLVSTNSKGNMRGSVEKSGAIPPGLFREPNAELVERFSEAEEARLHLFGFPRHLQEGGALERAGAIQREHDAGPMPLEL